MFSEKHKGSRLCPTVYLAGPMAGCPDPNTWRREFKIWAHGFIRCIDPIHDMSEKPMGIEPKGIVVRDHMHATKCDLLYVNFDRATKVSIGTMFEMAWAYHCHIPIVVLCRLSTSFPPVKNDNDHPMTRGCATFWCVTETEAHLAVSLVLRDYLP